MVAVLRLLAGCADPAAPSPSARTPFVIVPPSGLDAVTATRLQVALADAAADWNQALGRDVFRVWTAAVAPELPSHVYVRVATEAEGFKPAGHAAGTWDTGTFHITVRSDFVSDPNVLRHELGHVLGLLDVDSPDEVMHSPAQPWRRVEISAAEVDEVRAFFGWVSP